MFKIITDTSAGCDLCGDKPHDGRLYLNEKQIYVCEICRLKLEAMPAKVRDKIEHYLIGNIL